MTAVTRDERRRAFNVDSGAWRDPSFACACEDVIEVALETVEADSSAELVPAAVRRLLPEGHVRSWAVITVDDNGGLHRDRESAADPGLYARAVAWLWTATADPCSGVDGAAYVEAWLSDGGAEGVACMPLIREDTVKGLIAVWLTADDMDAIVCDVSRLTLIGHLWAGIQARSLGPRADDASSDVDLADALTVRQSVILQGMAQGLTNAQIARQINFSESTVRLESLAIYRFLGVHSRADAVHRAQALGAL